MNTIRKQLKLYAIYPYDSSYFLSFYFKRITKLSFLYIFLAIDMNINQREESLLRSQGLERCFS